MSRTRQNTEVNATILVAYRVAAGLFALLVLGQAALAGQFLNGQSTMITVHRALGAQVLPLLSLVLVVLSVFLRHALASRGYLAVPVALLVLTTLQTGLGFLGRNSLGAAGWHVPLGVAIFGLGVYHLTFVRGLLARPT